MQYQFTLYCESFEALATLIWFLYSVCPLMVYETSIISKTPSVLVLFILYLPSVCLEMIYKIYILWESIATMAALIWLSLVNPFLKKPYHIGCIDMVYQQYVSSYELWGYHYVWKPYHIGCIGMVYLQYALTCAII